MQGDQPSSSPTVTIPLTQGKVTILDAADATKVFAIGPKWHAKKNGNTFYAQHNVRKPDGTRATVQMHRAILGITNHSIQVDHRNGNGLDNQRHNLRVATNAQNKQNACLRNDNTSGVRGVSWDKDKNKWRAKIQVNGKTLFLGYFIALEDATAARLAAELKYHGEFSATVSRKKPPQSVGLDSIEQK